ncbi:MAG TPA: hypothetical protein VGN12_12310 [Pirellulales bacterium]
MARSNSTSVKACCCGILMLAATASVGCQSDYAGQTLPSAYWQKDDIQYFPPGPEFKLTREAAALKTYGTGRTTRPIGAPLGPIDEAPGPVPGGLDNGPAPGAAPAPRQPVGGPVVDEAPAVEAAPPAEVPADDPFNPQ